MKLGLFYQSGYRLEACFHAINQFRKHYPEAPIALYEDNTDILIPVADKFNCVYKKTDKQGYNDSNSGRPTFNLETTLAWLQRIYDSCLTTFKDVDWIMNFEDDVWFIRKINGIPPYDLTGIPGIGWDEELYNFLETSVRGAHGCGGSIFNKLKFIEAFNNLKNINWEDIDRKAKSPKPSEWTDSALTFIFLNSKLTVGSWSELSQYKNSKIITMEDRRGWPGSLEDLEKEQDDAAVIHCWKPFYYPTAEEIQTVKEKLYV